MSKIDQKEYLERYLCSNDKLDKKKKKKSKDKYQPVAKKTVKIIDDDKMPSTPNEHIGDGDLYAVNEEAPQIVGFIDERSALVIKKQEYEESGKWKSFNNPTDLSPLFSKKVSSSKKTKTVDESPPRKSKFGSYKRDVSPTDLPMSKIKQERLSSTANYIGSSKSAQELKRKIQKEIDSSLPQHYQKMTKTLNGKTSGLRNARCLKEENEQLKQIQQKSFDEMNPELSGKNADVFVRDRRRRNKDYEFNLENETKPIIEEEERKKEYDRLGKGLKQLEQIENKRKEYVHEANKPLARSQDDKDLQDYFKKKELAEDPMLQYIRLKRKEENTKKGIIEKPDYHGDIPDNRFNIRPGFRWDGVDRSNGYEKKHFSMINSKKSLEEDAYRYLTEDM